MKILIVTLLFILPIVSFSQPYASISGTIVNRTGAGIEGTSILLQPFTSGTKESFTVSSATGYFRFEKVPFGWYRVKISHVIYTFRTIDSLKVDNEIVDLKNVLIKDDSLILSGINISAQKPSIHVTPDRISLQVDNTIYQAGNSAFEILKRAPGVIIDGNETIQLRGKNGVMIYVDGKLTPLSSVELANFLKSIPGQTIERIDIITNPSSKYEAAGTAGIIDIRLKKDQRLGTNGTFSIGVGMGVKSRANSNILLNYKNKKLLLLGNLTWNYTQPFNYLFIYREFYKNDIYIGGYDQQNRVERVKQTPTGRFLTEFNLSKSITLGASISGTQNRVGRTGDNYSIALNDQRYISGAFQTLANGKEDSWNYIANLNTKIKLDSMGTELTIDADYGRYTTDWGSNLNTFYFDPIGQPIGSPSLNSSKQNGVTSIQSIKADLISNRKRKLPIDIGAKFTSIKADNQVFFYNHLNNVPILDSANSNRFIYSEENKAVYASINRSFGNISSQLGLRLENTRINGNQLFTNSVFDSSYTKVFPQFTFQYKISKTEFIAWQLSRRINRPAFNQLNPFKVFVDKSFITTGDPYLLPQFNWLYEMSYSNNRVSLSLQYNNSSNEVFVFYKPIENQDKIVLQLPVNISSSKKLGLNAILSSKIFSWWSVINSFNIYYNKYEGSFTTNGIYEKNWSGQASTNHNFVFKKGWQGEFAFLYTAKQDLGVLMFKPQYELSAGIQKLIMKNRANVKLGISDILWKGIPQAANQTILYKDHWKAERDTRFAILTFSYKFGNLKVPAVKQRISASDEERKRMGNN